LATYITNFDFTDHPLAEWQNGHAERVGNHWFQNDYSDTSQTVRIQDGVLSFESNVDDEAVIMDVDSGDFASRSYVIRAVLKVPKWDSFMYTGILAHADVGGTAHPETEGVALGLMRQDNEWYFKCKQWTDGDIYGYLQQPEPISDISPDRWYTLQLQVGPRGHDDTQFSGRLWECLDQECPTVAHTGKLLGSFDDLWNPKTGEWDNSDPPQWNPRLHNVGLFQWYGCPIRFRSFGIASNETDFQRPLIYTSDPVARVGQPIQFQSSLMTQPAELSWDFGDGSASSEPDPEKAFRTPGDYTVSLAAESAVGKSRSHMLRITVLPREASKRRYVDSFATGPDGWRFRAKGLNGTPDQECDPLYSSGFHDPDVDGGALGNRAFNHSPGSPAQAGANAELDNWDLKSVSAQWYKPIYLTGPSQITVSFSYRLTSENLEDDDVFALVITDNEQTVARIDLEGSHFQFTARESATFRAGRGVHRLGFGLWCDTLSTKPLPLDLGSEEDGPVDDTPRRCNLITHRMDHLDDNGRVTAWLTRAEITIGESE